MSQVISHSDLVALEFDKIQMICASFTKGTSGRSALLSQFPTDDITFIQQELDLVQDWYNYNISDKVIPFNDYDDISQLFHYFNVQDYIFSIEDFVSVRKILLIHSDIYGWLHLPGIDQTTSLYRYLHDIPFNDVPLTQINYILDDFGLVKDSASDSLFQIRQSIQKIHGNIYSTFVAVKKKYSQLNLLTEIEESSKNGRFVLVVPIEHKRQVKGVIVDDSSSGKTVFIEPIELIELYNELTDLLLREREEILFLLKSLSNQLRKFKDYIMSLLTIVTHLDTIRARAQFASSYNGYKPAINRHGVIHIVNGQHPMLYINYVKRGMKVVPFDCRLDSAQRIILISGPNAGGKSITMKSVSLILLMAQTGYLVPCEMGTSLSVFSKFLTDIGDNQSITDDLSTYSAKLHRYKLITESADNATFIAIDEFGTGTDPKFGGAIAEAVLLHILERKSYGVITTHFSNLKYLASSAKGIINASMLYDRTRYLPTYQLKLGRPGSSYAFEIAQSVGLPKNIINKANSIIGDKHSSIEGILVNLEEEKRLLDENLLNAINRNKDLVKLIEKYELLLNELEYQKRKLKLDIKEFNLSRQSVFVFELDKEIKNLRNQVKLERVQQLRLLEEEKLKRLQDEVSTASIAVESSKTKLTPSGSKPIQIGSEVKMRGGGAHGLVLDIKQNKATVLLGEMKIVVDMSELEAVNPSITKKNIKSHHLLADNTENTFSNKLDIRGLTAYDAMNLLEVFLDKSVVSNLKVAYIIHGIGNGILKKTVSRIVKQYKDIKSADQALPEEGGAGVTVIKF